MYARFISQPPPSTRHTHVIFRDNCWFPIELERERQYLQSVDADAYAHVWEGACRTHSNSQIFAGKYTVEDFTPGTDWKDPLYGCDFGFSVDPSTLVKVWIHDNKLFVEHEAWQVGCELDHIGNLFDQVPGAKTATIRADCSRPETISYLQRHWNSRVIAAEKWSGSIEDGIEFLRKFEKIVVNPRCSHVIQEMKMYSYKTNKLTGDVLVDVLDADNHLIDSLRYALGPLIKKPPGWGFFQYMAEEIQAGRAPPIPSGP